MAVRIIGNVQLFTHYNFSATTTATDISAQIPAHANYILLDNLDTANNMLVSLDGGTNFKTIGPKANITLDVDNFLNRNPSIKVKSSSGTISVECLFGSEA